jgi:putative Mg2+ transporter-C (MgtC) family protein
MPTSLEWYEVALRLALTVVGGAILGIDRSEHSRPAGLRTVLLVSLAASFAMVLANLMITTHGKASDSFVQLDMMRLPLGILTGVGFIGAGAIIRREDVVLGVTTAATLWFASVVGLCFGAGQIWLGIAGVALGFFALTGLRRLEDWLPQDHRAVLILVVDAAAAIVEPEIRRRLIATGYMLGPATIGYADRGQRREYRWDVTWTSRRAAGLPAPPFLDEIAGQAGVVSLSWQPGRSANCRRPRCSQPNPPQREG